jgi:hypothetical protein
MANVTLDLNRFKASGVYTVEFDASERIVVNTNTLRLVVGFSRKGPFNTPVFLRDVKEMKTVFGDTDKFLESRGSFFHRSLITCLRTGPVYALNLLPLNNKPISDGGDAVDYMSYSLSATEANGTKTKSLYESFYDTQRFFKLSEDNLISVSNNSPLNTGKLLSFVNIGQTPISVFVRKAVGIKGYDITAKEYYSQLNQEVPDYVYEWDSISEYFLQVDIVQGDWSNYSELAINPVYSTYFDKKGIKKNQINNFLASPEVIKIGSFVGCIIPDFIDSNNINQSLDTIINNGTSVTGLFCAINREQLGNYVDSTSKIDLVGHSFGTPDFSGTKMDFLSYKANLDTSLDFTFGARQINTNQVDVSELNVSPNNTPGDAVDQQPDFSDYSTYSCTTSNDFFTLDSSKVGGAYGWFDNVLSIKKPLSTDTDFTLEQYNEIKNSLVVAKSNILLNTNDNDELARWGVVRSVAESIIGGNTYLKVSYTHPAKEDESTRTPYAIDASSSSSIIKFSSATDLTTDKGLAEGRKVLVSNGTIEFYATIASTSYNSATDLMSVTIVVNSEFAELVSAGVVSNYTVTFGSYVCPRIYENAGYNNIAFAYQPAAFDMVYVDGYNSEDDVYVAYPYSDIYKAYEDISIVDGEYYSAELLCNSALDPDGYLKFQRGKDANGMDVLYVYVYSDENLNSKVADTNIECGGTMTVTISAESLKTGVELQSWDTSRTVLTFDETSGAGLNVGEYLVSIMYDESGDESYHMSKIKTKVKKVNAVSGIITYQVTISQPAYIQNESTDPTVIHYKGIENLVTNYQLMSMSGFKMTEYHLPSSSGTKNSQLEKILGVLENTNIFETLSDSDIIDFRYIIDTFDGGLAPQLGAKNILSRLAKNRGKCLAFLNPPSLKQFFDSSDPRFTDEPNPGAGIPRPVINTEYIAAGGNLSLGPSFTFSLPDEDNGAKYCGVFFPYIVLRENNKNILVPPSAHVSNNFVQKFISGYPYAIVAGTKRGIISDPNLVGVESDLFLSDREVLEPIGFNPIVTKRGKGTLIYANQTTFQKTISAFNNLHVRDLLITIEQSIESILTNFIFDFNDEATRLEIKNKVASFLEGVRTAGGVYDYRVIMDETNNTQAIIDQNIGIVDVQIEPARGLQKIINRITVFKTGGIASGGFTIV